MHKLRRLGTNLDKYKSCKQSLRSCRWGKSENSVVTVGITLLAALLVFGTDYDFSWTGTASAVCMGVGIVGVLGVSLISSPALGLIAFLFILLGFLFDLVYEIYLTSDNARTPLANGIGIYIAFAGVFVNILQIVLEVLSER